MKKLQTEKTEIDEIVAVDLKDVNYIDLWHRTKNSNSKLAYHTTKGSFQDIDTLADAAEAYQDKGFVMIGRTALVQESKIDTIASIENNGSLITFKDGTQLYVLKQV
ncbi:LytTR family transcriptional regulator DNA-binding domain-containing protein [Paenibacillus sp. RS8]